MSRVAPPPAVADSLTVPESGGYGARHAPAGPRRAARRTAPGAREDARVAKRTAGTGRRAAAAGLALGLGLVAAPALAGPNDLELRQLGNPTAGAAGYRREANADFRAMANVLGATLTSVNLMPPETTGHAAWSLNAELSVVALPGEDSFTLPTRGRRPSSLLVPAVHVRKGLPFSVELGARVQMLEKSSQYGLTGELKVAALEGFTWLPDVGVRLHGSRLLGQRDFELGTAGLDIGVGKQFPLGGMVTLTPYGGYDLVGVSATSKRVDFRPERTAEEGATQGLQDTAEFQKVSFGDNLNHRIYGGVRFIGGVLQLGAELSLTGIGTVTGDDGAGGTAERSVGGVLAFNTTLGLDF